MCQSLCCEYVGKNETIEASIERLQSGILGDISSPQDEPGHSSIGDQAARTVV